jgi:hypothetical protein
VCHAVNAGLNVAATVAGWLNAKAWGILNHVSGSFAAIVGVYQRHDFANEKREALEKWAAHLSTIVGLAKAAAAA